MTITAIANKPYSADGVDTVTNIHAIRFLDGDTSRILDDHQMFKPLIIPLLISVRQCPAKFSVATKIGFS